MNAAEIIARLSEHADELRRMGVARAALFGSTARGEAGPESDIDVGVRIDPDAGIDLWAYSGVVLFIQDLFETKVDVADLDRLRPFAKANIERDLIYAF